MDKAYMIRNDGKAFSVMQHYYGNIDEVTETLYAGEWLYDHTQNESVKDAFIKLVAAYAKFYEGLENPETLLEDLKKVIAGYPYRYLSVAFVERLISLITKEFNDLSGGKSDIEKYSKIVIDNLNQEFLRARYGGLYNSSSSSREMVFRVSSNNFNWYNIIWEFVFENQGSIDCVTIVRDEESTGVQNEFYIARDGSKYDRYPLDDFLTEKGNPVVETNDLVQNYLLSGKPLADIYSLPMNSRRIEYRLECLFMRENRQRNFWKMME